MSAPQPDGEQLRQQLRRACAEADGFGFESLEPHDYQAHADAILPVLDAAVAAEVRRTLEGIADEWSAHCPDHSTSAQTSMACRCDDANELRMRAEGVREDVVARGDAE